MKTLNELYPGIGVDTQIKAIKINSKEVNEGDLFVCTKGVTADRHDFIDDAIKHGAAAIIVSRDVGEKSVPIIKVPDTNRELPYLCQKFYDYPDNKLKMIGDGEDTTSLSQGIFAQGVTSLYSMYPSIDKDKLCNDEDIDETDGTVLRRYFVDCKDDIIFKILLLVGSILVRRFSGLPL